MTELLGALALAVMVGAQFLAVIAVHRTRQDTHAGFDTIGTMRAGDHDLHVLSERPGRAADPAWRGRSAAASHPARASGGREIGALVSR
jgi:hypothetical protein